MNVLIDLFMERFFNRWMTMSYVNCPDCSCKINVLIAINIRYKSTICRLYKRWDALLTPFGTIFWRRSNKDAAFDPRICSFTLANFLCSLRTPSFSLHCFLFLLQNVCQLSFLAFILYSLYQA